jgi:23S rRNA (adenine2030-N6)-methyltransferase
VSGRPSRYRPDTPPDYSHRFHAGNVGDVWKHCALVEVLRAVAASAARVTYLESHAGEGRYPLGATGEWTEGIGRLWDAGLPANADAVARYVALCRRLGAPESYPGSPVFARAVLGPRARLLLWEREPAAFGRLSACFRDDAAATLAQDDGLRSLAEKTRAAEADGDAVVVLIDPPFTQKRDWTEIPDALAAVARAAARACLLLWYPVKSLTRPNAMLSRLETAGVLGAMAELITTPLDYTRHRLNGSGMLIVRPPDGALAALAAAAPIIGARCATHAGAWSFRMRGVG